MELYNDDAVCFVANRYHVSTQEAIKTFLVQSGIAHGEISDFRLEDNELEIIKGLMDTYASAKDKNINA